MKECFILRTLFTKQFLFSFKASNFYEHPKGKNIF